MANTKPLTRGAYRLAEWVASQGDGARCRLASDLGVKPNAISNIVHGHGKPSLRLAALLQARTKGYVRVTDWLDDGARYRMDRLADVAAEAG